MKASNDTNTLKIWIPASVEKHKHWTVWTDNSLLSEAKDAPSTKKKSKSSTLTPSKPSMKDVKDDNTLLNIVTKQAKRWQGYPKAANVTCANKDFLVVPVFLEIAQELVLMRGKTHKRDRFVKQPPITDGPFHLTQKITWQNFKKEVADIAGIDKENFSTISKGLKWSF
jgi:hypothetical protein